MRDHLSFSCKSGPLLANYWWRWWWAVRLYNCTKYACLCLFLYNVLVTQRHKKLRSHTKEAHLNPRHGFLEKFIPSRKLLKSAAFRCSKKHCSFGFLAASYVSWFAFPHLLNVRPLVLLCVTRLHKFLLSFSVAECFQRSLSANNEHTRWRLPSS